MVSPSSENPHTEFRRHPHHRVFGLRTFRVDCSSEICRYISIYTARHTMPLHTAAGPGRPWWSINSGYPFTGLTTPNISTCCCCCCYSHINSHDQVRGYRTNSSHSGAEEYPREISQTTQGGTHQVPDEVPKMLRFIEVFRLVFVFLGVFFSQTRSRRRPKPTLTLTLAPAPTLTQAKGVF